jgi:putative membrane protein
MKLDVSDLPHIIASLNGLSVVLLSLGYIFIRQGQWQRHRTCMISALCISGVFLVVYLYYKANSGFAKFGGTGWVRPVYFSILIAHIIGAIAIVPLVPLTVFRALKQQFDKHRKIARWTWPIWIYVGVSGVVVYIMTIHLFPHHG